jgi:hypothetical protein
LTANVTDGDNYGDIPAPFVVTYASDSKGKTYKISNDLFITIPNSSAVYNLIWDSKTGMVSGKATSSTTSTRKAIPYTGDSLGAIPVGKTTTIALNGATLKYHYWYY